MTELVEGGKKNERKNKHWWNEEWKKIGGMRNRKAKGGKRISMM